MKVDICLGKGHTMTLTGSPRQASPQQTSAPRVVPLRGSENDADAGESQDLAGAMSGLPVAVIGAGPVGLAAASELVERGVSVEVFEAGASAGHAIGEWAHVRLFSPWEYLVDRAAARLLRKTGWSDPDPTALPTGGEFLERYLRPLAESPAHAPLVHYDSVVVGVSRLGMDRTRSAGRSSTPFELRVMVDGSVRRVLARAVIDASGTWASPNPLASNGLALPEHPAVIGRLPDFTGDRRAEFSEIHTVVVGSGHSAANALVALAELADEKPATSITWVIRSPALPRVSDADELGARARLGSRVRDLADRGLVSLVDGFEIDGVLDADGGRVELVGSRLGDRMSIVADRVVNATGFRPDLSILREIRTALDDVVEAPVRLAPLIDPNVHSCGTVPPHGVDELSHPDANFFIAGMKS